MKNTIQFQLSEETLEALRVAAALEGITASILARMILHKHFTKPDAESKSYTFTAKNWSEVETYVEAKGLGSVEVFAGFAMTQYITKYPLTEGQKRRAGENNGNADIPF
jgi:hypothetical protein